MASAKPGTAQPITEAGALQNIAQPARHARTPVSPLGRKLVAANPSRRRERLRVAIAWRSPDHPAIVLADGLDLISPVPRSLVMTAEAPVCRDVGPQRVLP